MFFRTISFAIYAKRYKNAILGAGFTDVVEVEQVFLLIEQINKYVKTCRG